MKKFLPLIIFVFVFGLTLAVQLGLKIYKSGDHGHDHEHEHTEVYQKYEQNFLKGKFKDFDGKDIELTKINSKVVIVNFWASWCLPCMEEIPSMIALKNKFKNEDLAIVAFNADMENQRESILSTKKKMNLGDEFIIIPDTDGEILNQFDITALPVTIIYSRGRIVLHNNGPMDFNSVEIEEKIKNWATY